MVPDTTTFGGCLEILRKLGVEDRMPLSVLRRLRDGAAGTIPENPGPADPIFRKKMNVLVGSNSRACDAAARAARRLGYCTQVLTTCLQGDTGEAAGFHLSIAREIAIAGRPLSRPACLISGGETTVRVTGDGRGGRNQEFALHCVRGLSHLTAPCVAASLATDGTDGPTDAAGALADHASLERSQKLGAGLLEDCLRRNDSYEFFKRLDDLIVTGPTRTNVMDLHFLLIG
jgi:hydroxypyruvate reductase